jgi:hypothetical protein
MAEPLSVTLDDILSWDPCYDREDLEELAAGRERITAAEILDLPIPIEDRLWAVLRPELIPEPVLHEWACRCAERALKREREKGREPDARCWAAIETKRAWLKGEATDEQLAAARDAASTAVRDAARDAARAAASAAAWAAARDAARAAWDAARAAARDAARAARDAASAAAWAAARDAARVAARVAARDAQIADLKALLDTATNPEATPR